MCVSLPGELCSKTTCDHMNSTRDRINVVPHVINAVSCFLELYRTKYFIFLCDVKKQCRSTFHWFKNLDFVLSKL